jgi:hypothetical protein
MQSITGYVCSSTWFSTLMREGVETAPVLGNPMWALVRHSLRTSTCSVSLHTITLRGCGVERQLSRRRAKSAPFGSL